MIRGPEHRPPAAEGPPLKEDNVAARGWRWSVLLLPPMLLGALALRLPTLGFYPFQDESALELMGLVMASSGSPHPLAANWPPLFHYLQLGLVEGLALLGLGPSAGQVLAEVGAAGFTGADPYLQAGRALSGLFGVLTVLCTALLGRRLLGEGIGLWAGLLLAAAPLSVSVSRLAGTDALCALLTTLVLWLAAEAAVRRRPRRWLAVAGLAAGLAAGAKYFGGLAILAPLGVALLPGPAGVDGRSKAARIGDGLLVCLCALAGLLASIPGLLHDPGRYLAWLDRHAADSRQGWEFFRGYPRGWLHHPLVTFRWGLGGMGGALLGMGGLFVLWVRDASARRTLLAFGAAWFAVIGYSAVLYGRYWMPFLPLLCLGAAWAVRALAGGRGWAAHAALALIVGWSLCQTVPQALVLHREDTRTQAARWLASRAAPGTAVATLYPLRADPEHTAALLREVRARAAGPAVLDPLGFRPEVTPVQVAGTGRGSGGERQEFLAGLARSQPGVLAHLLWDSAYPALDPTLFPLVAVSAQNQGMLRGLEALREGGVVFYLWSSFRDGIVASMGRPHFPERAAFLEELEALCGPPVAVFDPGRPDPRIPLAELETRLVQSFAPVRPGPELRIYALPR